MGSQKQELATRLLAVPGEVRAAVDGMSDGELRHRPAPGEWSAIEVVGHLVDKMEAWRGRVERLAGAEPGDDVPLPPYDQDADVARNGYQDARLGILLGRLDGACRRFADEVVRVPDDALTRTGHHGEYGEITLVQCVELPLDSIPDHLAQLRAAAASASAPG